MRGKRKEERGKRKEEKGKRKEERRKKKEKRGKKEEPGREPNGLDRSEDAIKLTALPEADSFLKLMPED